MRRLHAPECMTHQSPCPTIAAFPPAFARVLRLRLTLRVLDHSHCIQPQARTWVSSIRNRGFAVMAVFAMVCRAGSRCAVMSCAAAWCALVACSAAYPAGSGCPFLAGAAVWRALVLCSAASPAKPELHPAAAKPVCLNAAETRELV